MEVRSLFPELDKDNCFSISTLIYDNRVTKHFVISLNFPCLSLFTVLFAYVDFGCFAVGRDLCKSGSRQNFVNFGVL